MRLVSYIDQETVKVGILEQNMIVDISDKFTSMQALINEGKHGIEQLKQLLQTKRNRIPIHKEQLLPPLPTIERNIICVGWNYLKHFNERERTDIELPEKPTVFTKATRTIAGPYESIPVEQSFTNKLDYEAELAVVIGEEGKNIPEEEALSYVFGYMCANDLSARDVQHAHGGQWFLGKSMDKSCPIGPWIVTNNEIDDVQNLDITCKVNGEVVQSSNTKLMMFPIARIIAELSKGMTLMPGDIILTGTPEGIGAKRTPPLFLNSGDVVEVSIQSIGQIENTIL